MALERAGYANLVNRLDAAVSLGQVDAITEGVKHELSDLLAHSALQLPAAYWRTRPDSYARRLLYRNPELDYTAVVMTWGPGQCTPLHDHGGLWCVEGVVDGMMEVTQFDLASTANGLFAFAERGRIQAVVGTAGSLIPPWDYHILRNALPDRPSVTLHVYGGDLSRCHVFLPRPDGHYERQERALTYHDDL